ncbi:hypothetical protein SGLAM104S_02879 [Streptomyces glaucescens]
MPGDGTVVTESRSGSHRSRPLPPTGPDSTGSPAGTPPGAAISDPSGAMAKARPDPVGVPLLPPAVGQVPSAYAVADLRSEQPSPVVTECQPVDVAPALTGGAPRGILGDCGGQQVHAT